jgi:hypothetical protein
MNGQRSFIRFFDREVLLTSLFVCAILMVSGAGMRPGVESAGEI